MYNQQNSQGTIQIVPIQNIHNSPKKTYTACESDQNTHAIHTLEDSRRIPCAQYTYVSPPGTQTSQCSPITEKAKNINMPAIFVLGDQQVRDFAQEIKIQRERNNWNTWNNVYTVSGLSKPWAPSMQILSNLDDYIKTLQDDDIVILGLGSNDKNPYLLLSEMSIALRKLKRFRVFVLNVINNMHLNVDLLNTHLKLIVKNFPNCMFIDSTENIYRNTNYNAIPKRMICYKLNIEIDNINYKKMMDVALKLRCTQNTKNVYHSIDKDTFSSIVKKKGTIPYYFNVQKKNIGSSTPKCSNINVVDEFFRN